MHTTDADTSETVTAFKAFNADFSCRGFQYAVGQTYTHKGKIKACRAGFHACENPMDVWSYYPIVGADGALTRYAEVELSGAMDKGADKIAAAQITIRAELRTPDFIHSAVDWVINATREKGDNPSGDSALIGSSGYGARIGSSGDGARIGSSGDGAIIACAGSAIVTAGPGSAICIAYHDGTRGSFAIGYVGEDGIEAGKAYRADPETGSLVEVSE